jgi:hypothetical protein
MTLGAKDLIDPDNVERSYREGKFLCFVLKNGFTVKLDPNEVPEKAEVKNVGHIG